MKLRTTALVIILVLVIIMLVFIVFSLMLDTSSALSAQVATYPPFYVEPTITPYGTPYLFASITPLLPTYIPNITPYPPIGATHIPSATPYFPSFMPTIIPEIIYEKGEQWWPLTATATATSLSRVLRYSVQQIENILFMINPEYLNVGPR